MCIFYRNSAKELVSQKFRRQLWAKNYLVRDREINKDGLDGRRVLYLIATRLLENAVKVTLMLYKYSILCT